jgi:endoglucanase
MIKNSIIVIIIFFVNMLIGFGCGGGGGGMGDNGTNSSQQGVNLAGAEFGSVFPGIHGFDYIYPNSDELDYYKSKCIKLVRLPFRWERMQSSLYGPLDEEELGLMDTFVAEARARGMKVIPAPHNHARYYGQLIGSSDVPMSAFEDFWKKMASHFKNEPAIYAYALVDEPYDTGGLWPAAAQAAIDGIRAVDMTHTIMVPGDGYSAAHVWPENNPNLSVVDPANNFVYEAHIYFDLDGSGRYVHNYDSEGGYPEIGIDRVDVFIQWLDDNNAQGFIGGYGVPDTDERWLDALELFLAHLQANDLSGTYWAGGPWWDDYPLSIEPRDGNDRPQMEILARYSGTNCTSN